MTTYFFISCFLSSSFLSVSLSLALAVLPPALVLRLVGRLAIVGRAHTDSFGSTTRHERFLLTAHEGPPGLGKNFDVRRSRPFAIVKRHLDGLETLAQDVRSAAVVPRRHPVQGFRQREELPLIPSP